MVKSRLRSGLKSKGLHLPIVRPAKGIVRNPETTIRISNMHFISLIPFLALTATGSAIALPSPSDPTAPLNGSISVSVSLPSTLSKRASGADGTLYYRWISARSFAASYRIKDLSSDGHPVYIETEVYDINDNAKYVLRCNNNNGKGSEITCAEKTYTHGSTVIAIAPHVCVNVQLGSDQCTTGGTIRNPYY